LKGKPGPVATLLRPILDTYMDAAVAIVGCSSRGLERYSCEYDVLVVTPDRRPPTSLRIGDVFVDLAFASEKEVLKPVNPEHAISLALARPIRDTSLVLSTASAANTAILAESARKASGTRLTSSLKTLGRADAALARGSLVDADFWLLAASYEYGYARLLSKEILPSPSHLLSQLRETIKGSPRSFEGVSIGAGLEASGRAGCGARLEGLAVLHDLLREGSQDGTAESAWPRARTEMLVAKAQELVTRVELAECYSFLGQELVDDMMNLLRLHPKQTLASLTAEKDRLLGERLMRQLGLARKENSVRSGMEVVKQQVSLLARKA
jgi:hypothetical protein